MTKVEKSVLLFSLLCLLLTLCWFFRQSPPAEFSAYPLPGATEQSLARLNINTASAEELECLPGIGPVLAERIIDHIQTAGPMKSTADLTAVSGIGEKTAAALENYICYEEDTP